MNRLILFAVSVLLLTSSAYARMAVSADPPDSNTVALWHFDEGSGAVLHDATGFHHDGTIHFAAWVEGKFGGGLRFNGVSSYVSLPTTPALKPMQAFTLEAWIAPDTLYFPQPSFNEYSPVILSTLGQYPYGGGYQLDLTNLGVRFDVRAGTPISLFSDFMPLPAAHQFYHVAATYERILDVPTPYTLMKTYLNGVLADSSLYIESIHYYDTPYLYIGTNVDGAALGTPYRREFPGIIDEVRISRIAKTAAQLNAKRLLVSAYDVDLGLVEVGQSAQRSLAISNASFTESLHVDSIAGANGAFQFESGGFDLVPRGSQFLSVTYSPAAAVADTGMLTIYAGTAENPVVHVTLRGKGFTFAEAPVIKSIADIPHDEGNQVRIIWYPSVYDTPGEVPRATEYGVWRRVDETQGAAAQADAAKGERRTVSIGGQLWDFVETVPAVQFDLYAYVAPTLANSTFAGPYWSVFRVSAHTDDGEFFFSEPDSGFSTDDTAPPPPPSVNLAVAAAGITLSWPAVDAPDLRGYVVYRSTSPITARLPVYRIATPETPSFADGSVEGSTTYYYAIASVDRSNNESVDAITASATTTVGAGDGDQVPHEFSLAQNYPNPFNPSTMIRYALAEQSQVRLSVFNPLGQRVASLVDGVQGAGYYEATWSADAASGIYFYKLEATPVNAPENAYVSLRKMILLR